MAKKAIVLLSGGLDSTTVLAMARAEGFELYALSFSYGQRHSVELDVAKRVAASMGVTKHVIVDINLREFGGSALTADIDVPKDRPLEQLEQGIPVTYVPGRNTIFLAFALAWAEVLVAEDIFIGVNALDYSGYPDCRPQFINAMQRVADTGTRIGSECKAIVTIHAPLMRMTKAQIITKGVELGVDYSLTHSCYDPTPEGLACGRCDSCQLRRRGFEVAGVTDPTRYAQ